MMPKCKKRDVKFNGEVEGNYFLGTRSPSKSYYVNGFLNQSIQSCNSNYGPRYKTPQPPLPRNSSPVAYPLTYPQLQTKDVVCGFCKHRFYIGKDLKGTYTPLLLPCGHATCSTCEAVRPDRACFLCPEFPVDVESRKRLPCNLYVIGLVHAIVSAPLDIEDPDIKFHAPLNAIVRQNFDQGICSECGMVAYYDCKQCEVRYCNNCFKKMHRKALQSHKPILLNKNAFDFVINTFCPNHECEYTEYYCNDCEFEGCSHCIIQLHKGHNTVSYVEKNKEWMLEFRAAFTKLQDTRMRIHQTQESLASKMICPEALKQAQQVENQITRHFVHLHGVLQNLERELRNKLHEQRLNRQRDIEDFRSTLAAQEEKLTSACALAAGAESYCGRVNLQKLTQKLLELADTPCHVLPAKDYKEEMKMETDPSVFDSIRQHVQLHVPDIPRFQLVKTDDLPQDYELEPLPLVNETMITESSFRLSSQRDVTSPTPSSQSRSSSQSINGSMTAEPSSLEKGTKEIVKITNLVDPTEFYVQRISTRRILEEIETHIAKYVENDASKPEEIILNSLYVAQNYSKGKWSRGRVISATDGSPVTYKVLFIDYGYERSGLTLNDIRRALPYFNIQPGLAVRCSLGEIAPIDGSDWDTDTLMQLRDMLANSTQLIIQVLYVNEPVCTVDLTSITNNNTSVSIRDWLIDVKLAKPVTYHKLKRMNPLSANQWYYGELPIEKYTEVKISYIESPNSIYVYPPQQEKEYEVIMREFNREYSQKERQEDLTIKYPEYGNTVAVKNKKTWRRGMITRIYEDSTIDVFFIDIGTTERVALSEVRRLSSNFRKWNARVNKISLVDIEPFDDGVQWSAEAIDFLKTHLQDNIVQIIPFSKTDNSVYHVCMYYTKNKININALLVSHNYAQSTGHRSKHSVLHKDISVSKKNRKKSSKNGKTLKENTASTSPIPKQEKMQPVEENDPYKVRVYIHKIISPDVIYVSDCSNRENYKTMKAEMQKFYKSKKGSVNGPLNPKWIYCVYSRKDKQFCRAQLVETSEFDPNIVKMSLVDLGEVEEVSLDEIQPLDPRFLDVPKYQFKVRLAGYEPCGGSKIWQSSSCQKLKDIIHDTGDFKYYITLIEDSGPTDPMPVQLFIKRNVVAGPTEPNRKEIISVGCCLAESGLALPNRGFNMKDQQLKELAVELKKKLQLNASNYDNTKQNVGCSTTIIEEEPIVDDSDDKNENIQNVTEVEKDKYGDVSSDSTPLPPKLVDWIEPAHIKETNFNANITFVDYEGNVHFHPDTKEYNDTLQYISDTLFKHYDKKSIKKYDYNWEKGDLCIASFHADKKWYRGKVIDVKNHQTVVVLFVDYGNIEECSVGSLKKRIILEHLPIQCTTASIAGIKPVGRFWKESDLDIIHAAIVSKPCQIKIVSRPPNKWEVAIWIKSSGDLTYNLPWYIMNETTATHVEVVMQNNKYYRNDDDIQELLHPTKSVTKIEKLIIPVNSEDSSECSNDDEDSNSTTNNTNSVKSGIDSIEIQDFFSDTVRENPQFLADTTPKINHCNLSTIVHKSQSFSKTNLDNSSAFNLGNISFNKDIDENFISGNSIYQNVNGNDDFETESVRSEALLQDIRYGHFEASTPLNTSFQDFNLERIFAPIDFSMYAVNRLEICISSLLSNKVISASVIRTTNEELNQWFEKARAVQNEIFEWAENQPVLNSLEAGQNCVARFKDGAWYRARTVKRVATERGSGFQVEFVDFGNREIMYDNTSFRIAKDEWLQIPMTGIHFKLHNVQFIKTQRSKDFYNALLSILQKQPKLVGVIKKYDPILELELYWDDECQESVFTEMFENGLLEILDSSID